MLKRYLLISATALAAVVATSLPSSAAVFTLTPFQVTPGAAPGTQAAFGNTITGGGTIDDYYGFRLTGASNEVSIATDSAGDITNFKIQIISTGNSLGGTVFSETFTPSNLFIAMETAVLSAGDFLLHVTGVAAATTAYNGTASFTTLAVPGPVAGAGLMSLFGLAGAFVMKRRREASLAA